MSEQKQNTHRAKMYLQNLQNVDNYTVNNVSESLIKMLLGVVIPPGSVLKESELFSRGTVECLKCGTAPFLACLGADD